jgi:hypothetical protein
LEWLARATNWAKFTATASLGVIHKVQYTVYIELMDTELKIYVVEDICIYKPTCYRATNILYSIFYSHVLYVTRY